MLRIRFLAAVCACAASSVPAPAQSTIRVTNGVGGADADGGSNFAHVTGDGRFVAFLSAAENLSSGDTHPGTDIFLYDATTAAIDLVSVRIPGGPPGGAVSSPSVSDDGNLVVFSAEATDLVAGEPAGLLDVYVRNRAAGTTTRITAGWNGPSTASSITPDGRFVFFSSGAENVVPSAPGVYDAFRYEIATGQFVLVSRPQGGGFGNGSSASTYASADGNVVVFDSSASNLVPGDTNGRIDAFVRDIAAGTTQRCSIGHLGQELGSDSTATSISRDGRFVCFTSRALGVTPDGLPGPSQHEDVYVYDRTRSSVVRVTTPGTPPLGGRAVTGVLTADGRQVVFASDFGGLVSPDPTPGGSGFDLYFKDLVTGSIEIVSLADDGSAAIAPGLPSVSADGRYVAFGTEDALVPGDTNGFHDIYLRDRGPAVYTTPCAGDGTGTPCPCGNPGAPGRGCENYALSGGVLLSAVGAASLANDTLRLQATGFLPMDTPIAYVQGDGLLNGGSGVPFGDGIQCAGGSTVRFGRRLTTNGTSGYGAGIAGDAPVSVAGQVAAPGSTRYYQIVYFNFGSFCGQLRRNWSNSIAIVWGV